MSVPDSARRFTGRPRKAYLEQACPVCFATFEVRQGDLSRANDQGVQLCCSKECAGRHLRHKHGDPIIHGPDWLAKAYRSTFNSAAGRCAKQVGEEQAVIFELTFAQYRELIERARHRCEITGIPFSLKYSQPADYDRRPFAPSLDRIDSMGPYSLDNCRLVCVAANLAMNTWGESVLKTIAEALVKAPCNHAGLKLPMLPTTAEEELEDAYRQGRDAARAAHAEFFSLLLAQLDPQTTPSNEAWRRRYAAISRIIEAEV